MSDQQENTEPEQQSQPKEEMSAHEVEKREEAKLKAKYPSSVAAATGRPVGGHSAFLQKRLAKGQKYFDSGDYQMAKQRQTGANKPPLKVVGDAIPTPESVPARKTSIIQPSKFTPNIS